MFNITSLLRVAQKLEGREACWYSGTQVKVWRDQCPSPPGSCANVFMELLHLKLLHVCCCQIKTVSLLSWFLRSLPSDCFESTANLFIAKSNDIFIQFNGSLKLLSFLFIIYRFMKSYSRWQQNYYCCNTLRGNVLYGHRAYILRGIR